MAGVLVGARTGNIAISSGTTITMAQIVAASNHRVIVDWIDVSFRGISATDIPFLVEILVQSTAGTMSALTVNLINPADNETVQTTAQHTATVEPTAGTVLDAAYVHPQRGKRFFGPFVVIGGGRLGVRVNTPGQNGNGQVAFRAHE